MEILEGSGAVFLLRMVLGDYVVVVVVDVEFLVSVDVRVVVGRG